jgi:predicted ArsR family transcriptional regulator
MTPYPASPGSKTHGPSTDAATAISPRAPALRGLCMALLARENLTADEAAAKLGESILGIRPRFSELRALGLIADSGARRPSSTGRSSTVWGIVEGRGDE